MDPNEKLQEAVRHQLLQDCQDTRTFLEAGVESLKKLEKQLSEFEDPFTVEMEDRFSSLRTEAWQLWRRVR